MLNPPRITALFVALLLPVVGWAQSPPDGHTIDGLSHVESVAAAPDGDTFYATNFGDKLAPTAKDGNGFITKLTGDGSVETRRFLPADTANAVLHAPKGTVVINGHLYTADVDRIVGFDLETQSKVVDISLADDGVSFLNGLAAKNAQTLFASATNQGTIYRIDLQAGAATALNAEVPNANGVAYSGAEKTLHVVTYGGDSGGALWALQMTGAGVVEDTTVRTIQSGGRFDGLVHRGDDVLITSWGVKGSDAHPPALYRVPDDGTGDITTIPLPGWQGPADFDCAEERGCWIPNLPGTKVEVVRPSQR